MHTNYVSKKEGYKVPSTQTTNSNKSNHHYFNISINSFALNLRDIKLNSRYFPCKFIQFAVSNVNC